MNTGAAVADSGVHGPWYQDWCAQDGAISLRKEQCYLELVDSMDARGGFRDS